MSEFVFRGEATAEELAAVTAILTVRTSATPPEDGYRRWRRIRLAALREDPVRGGQSRVRPTTG